jgi:MEMO1 family protein
MNLGLVYFNYSSKPLLRNTLTFKKIELKEGSFFSISCVLGLGTEGLLLRTDTLPILALFDGSKTISEIAGKLTDSGIGSNEILQFANELNKYLLFDSDYFNYCLSQRKLDFARLSCLSAPLAGSAYPEDPLKLKNLINSYIKDPFDIAVREGKVYTDSQIFSLLSPHIDYPRGGTVYGKGYSCFKKDSIFTQNCELVLLWGTLHRYSQDLFILSDKDLLTPLGLIKSNREVVNKIVSELGHNRLFNDSYLHALDHSLELQLPFLQESLKGSWEILQVLVGSFEQFCNADSYPENYPIYNEFIDLLKSTLKDLFLAVGRRVVIVSSVDLSHVGRQFGDDFSVNNDKALEISQNDQLYLDAILRFDKNSFYNLIVEHNNQQRVCGFSTIYSFLDLVKRLDLGLKGELLKYDYVVDKFESSFVSFASIAFYYE